jgi:hypothetical protein
MQRFPQWCTLVFLGHVAWSALAAENNEDSSVDFSSDIQLGYGYDTNVAIDDVDLNTSQGDQFADLKLSGQVRVETENDASFSASVILSEKKYNTFELFDGRLSLTSLGVEKEISGLTLGLSLRYIDYQLDGSGFLDMYQVSPSLSWFPSRKTYVRSVYEYSDESFDRSPGRDNQQHKAGVTGYYFIKGLRKYMTLRAQVSRNSADDDVFEHDATELRLAYHQNVRLFAREAILKVSYRYQRRDYDEAVEPTIGGFREDRRHRYEIDFEFPVTKSLSIISDISANDYQSNLASADYSQRVFKATLKYSF